MNKVDILAHYYPLEDLLEQNDIEPEVVVRWLVDEGYINVDDYFYEDETLADET